MDSERNVVRSHLLGRQPDDISGFAGQAMNVKAGYYAWAGLADVRYCLAAPGVQSLRIEYGRHIYDGYRAANKLDLLPLVNLKRLIR
jgi:hypothetical protein